MSEPDLGDEHPRLGENLERAGALKFVPETCCTTRRLANWREKGMQPTMPPVKDWLLYLKSTEGKLGDEFDLAQLRPGDVLKVVTQHADYFLTIVLEREADLLCSRADRPKGRVSIIGCTFGLSSSIKPDHLFCGGNLEFTYQRDGTSMTHTTTAIRAIGWRREARK